MTLQAMINFPLMIGLILIAKPLVLVILTEKWLPCAVFFQLFCIINIFRPLLRSHQILLQAKGLSGILLYIDIAAKILIVANITITYRFGILYMLVGQFIITLLTYIVRSYYTSKLIEYSILEQFKDLIPYMGLTIIMGCLMVIIRPDYIKSPELFLVVSIFCGLFIYFTLCRLLRLNAFMELLDFIRTKLNLKKINERQ
jgi:O-antigen/teichoic acid export membrane protein